MIIQHATLENAQSLEDFLVLIYGEEDRGLTRDYIQAMFSNDYRKPIFLVLLEEGQIIGAVSYSEELFTVGVWGINWVSVHPDYRNKGLGQKLIEVCVSEIIAHEKRNELSIILLTYPDKTGLYDKTGFTTMGNDNEGGSFMIKNITKTS